MATTYRRELATAKHDNSELQDRLHSMTSEVVQLKNSLMEVSTERDGLKERLRCRIQSKTDISPQSVGTVVTVVWELSV